MKSVISSGNDSELKMEVGFALSLKIKMQNWWVSQKGKRIVIPRIPHANFMKRWARKNCLQRMANSTVAIAGKICENSQTGA